MNYFDEVLLNENDLYEDIKKNVNNPNTLKKLLLKVRDVETAKKIVNDKELWNGRMGSSHLVDPKGTTYTTTGLSVNSHINKGLIDYISHLAKGYTSRDLQLNAGIPEDNLFDLNKFEKYRPNKMPPRENGDMNQREKELIEKINKKPGNPTNTSIGNLKNPKSELNNPSGKNNTTTNNNFWGFNGSKNPLDWGGGTQIIGTALLAAGAYGLFKLYKKYKENKKSDKQFLNDHPEAKKYLDNNANINPVNESFDKDVWVKNVFGYDPQLYKEYGLDIPTTDDFLKDYKTNYTNFINSYNIKQNTHLDPKLLLDNISKGMKIAYNGETEINPLNNTTYIVTLKNENGGEVKIVVPIEEYDYERKLMYSLDKTVEDSLWNRFLMDNPSVEKYFKNVYNKDPYAIAGSIAAIALLAIGAYGIYKLWKKYRKNHA